MTKTCKRAVDTIAAETLAKTVLLRNSRPDALESIAEILRARAAEVAR